MVGFGVFANPGIVLQNDTRLVSALVERWRPETNTFFMRQGEMTVTLEDVGYILGLPVVGRPLVGDGIDGNQSYFERAWFEKLTPQQVKDGFTRGGVRLTWLFETYGSADPGPDPRRIAVHTQAYMFFVVGSILFPTSSRNVVHPRYIRHLRTLSHVRTWSWGSAVLSYLYRSLATAAQKGSKKISCCVWLLMLWSYERFASSSSSRIASSKKLKVGESHISSESEIELLTCDTDSSSEPSAISPTNPTKNKLVTPTHTKDK